MPRIKAGYKTVSVVLPEEVVEDLNEIHWTLRREVSEILTEAVTKFVDDAKASLGEA